MHKETITYTDYDGEETTNDFYFNLNKAEVIEMEMSWDGGLRRMLEKISAEKDQKRIMEMFKMIILKSYGEKSLDGKKFLKVDDQGRSLVQMNFVPTEAYSELFMKLASNDEAASDFINGIMPKNIESVEKKDDGPKLIPGPGSEMEKK